MKIMDYKRKLKELDYQSPYSIVEAFKRYEKKWERTSLVGSGIILDFTVLGGKAGFECFVCGEAFDEFIRPAIEQALKKTLETQLMYLDIQKSMINGALKKQ